MQGGRGSQFQDFIELNYMAKLIPSRVLQCVPTLGQPGILYLFNYKDVFSLLITLDWHLPVIQPLFLLTSVVWVTIKPMGPAKMSRLPVGKVCHPSSELTEARGRVIREFLVTHPPHSEVVTYATVCFSTWCS